MFTYLSDNLAKAFDKIKGKGSITENDVNSVLKEIKVALLEADVSLSVVKQFIETVKKEAVGSKVIKSITPSKMVIKIVKDKLTELLGEESQELNLVTSPPAVIMMIGLQGSGKTTSAAKLANLLSKHKKKKVLLASLDVYRPAAQEQLAILGEKISVETLNVVKEEDPIQITKRALDTAKKFSYDVVILDTAGRLHNDDSLIKELQGVKDIADPVESILVLDALTGQDAVAICAQFHSKVGITSTILTRVDGDSRGGAALSMKMVTNCPIKFIGTGENPNDFEAFHPERIASSILDMGDVVSFVEKASDVISEKEAEDIEQKLKKGSFNMNDLLTQFRSIKKMGNITQMIGMIPGASKLINKLKVGVREDDNIIVLNEAIILSMTKKERLQPAILNASRKKRIADGSGCRLQDVNRLIKQFHNISKMAKRFGKLDSSKMPDIEELLRAAK